MQFEEQIFRKWFFICLQLGLGGSVLAATIYGLWSHQLELIVAVVPVVFPMFLLNRYMDRKEAEGWLVKK